MTEGFSIPLSGLNAGESRFSWHAGKEFFEEFDNSEILDADLRVEALALRRGDYLGIDASVRGTLVVACDRCAEDLEIQVDELALLSVKFGDEPLAPEEVTVSPGQRETLYLPADSAEVDLGQTVYDFACLAVPMHHTHPEGECDPRALKYLDSEIPSSEGDHPFAALGKLLDKK